MLSESENIQTTCQGIREYRIPLPENMSEWPNNANFTYPNISTLWDSSFTGVDIVPVLSEASSSNYIALQNVFDNNQNFIDPINIQTTPIYPNPNPLKFCIEFPQEISLEENTSTNIGYFL